MPNPNVSDQPFTRPQVSVTHSVAQSIASGVLTALAFDTDLIDTDGMHDPAVNNTRITFNQTGNWIVGFAGHWNPSTAGTTRRLQIRDQAPSLIVTDYRSPSTVAGQLVSCNGVAFQRFTAGDFIELFALQDSGGALNLSNLELFFFAHRIG